MDVHGKRTPRQQLALAVAIEDANARRYREWAHRFRPFDPEVAELLDALAEEGRRHKARILREFRGYFSGELPRIHTEQIEDHVAALAERERHFFVVDRGMARRILRAVLDAEQRARAFYHGALHAAADPALHAVCGPLATFEEAHVDLIRRRLESWC